MIYAFWGTLAGVLVLFLAAAHQSIPTFGAREPTGAHHKPRKPPLRQRWRDRRQAEHVRDEATERLFGGMEVPPEIARDAMPTGIWHYESLNAEQAHARGWDVCDGGPLMPLPPEATRNPFADLELYGPELAACPHCDSPYGTVHGPRCPYDPDEPEDPHDVATPEDEADAYVGDLGPAELPAQPEPGDVGHLREGQYAEATGQFSRAVLDTYERAQVGVK